MIQTKLITYDIERIKGFYISMLNLEIFGDNNEKKWNS